MGAYADGCYSTEDGKELLANILAGKGTMYYTRVTVGNGALDSSDDPRTLKEVKGYVMDAKISGISRPENGQVQVTVQIRGDDIAETFTCTGLLLYAKDPEKGTDVPYTYLVLEDNPEPIRTTADGVSNIATFDIVTAVGELENVSAEFDGDSLITRSETERIIGTEVQELGEELTYIIGKTNRENQQTMAYVEVTIPIEGWSADSGPYGGVFVDVPVSQATEDSVPVVTIAQESASVASYAGLSAAAQAYTKKIRFYAQVEPDRTIKAYVALLSSYGDLSDGT